MPDDSVVRVHYYDKQFLRVQDFADEQAYHVAMRRRHNVANHSWGIVYGLEIALDDGGSPVVHPGLAVDGYGRELVLTNQIPAPLDPDPFTLFDTDTLDVWLVYNLMSSDQPPAGYGDADSANAFYRWQEIPELRLEMPDPDNTDPRAPKSVLSADQPFPPYRTPPDSPDAEWPVYLGRLQRAAGPPRKYTIISVNRPYAGLIGEEIDSPSGNVKMQVGIANANDPSRFAVLLKDLNPAASPSSNGQSTNPTFISALKIDANGALSVPGDTTFGGNVTLAKGQLEFAAGTARSDAAAPWTIYQVSADDQTASTSAGSGSTPAAVPASAGASGNPGGSSTGSAPAIPPPTQSGATPSPDTKANEIRIVLPADAGSSHASEVVIGVWDSNTKAFTDCLTIASSGDVTVKGRLTVQGELYLKDKLVNPDKYTVDAQRLIDANFIAGMNGSAQSVTGHQR